MQEPCQGEGRVEGRKGRRVERFDKGFLNILTFRPSPLLDECILSGCSPAIQQVSVFVQLNENLTPALDNSLSLN